MRVPSGVATACGSHDLDHACRTLSYSCSWFSCDAFCPAARVPGAPVDRAVGRGWVCAPRRGTEHAVAEFAPLLHTLGAVTVFPSSCVCLPPRTPAQRRPAPERSAARGTVVSVEVSAEDPVLPFLLPPPASILPGSLQADSLSGGTPRHLKSSPGQRQWRRVGAPAAGGEPRGSTDCILVSEPRCLRRGSAACTLRCLPSWRRRARSGTAC